MLLAQIPQTARVNKKEIKAPDVALPRRAEVRSDRQDHGRPRGQHGQGHHQGRRPVLHVFRGRLVHEPKPPNGPWEVTGSRPEARSTRSRSARPLTPSRTSRLKIDDDEWVAFADGGRLYGRDDRVGMRGLGQWLVLPARTSATVGCTRRTTRSIRLTATAPGTTRGPERTDAAWACTDRMAAQGLAARYNPRTGTYARGAAAYGPYGARGYAEAYNPRTGTRTATRPGVRRLRELGIDRRPARGPVGDDQTSHEQRDRQHHARDPGQRRRHGRHAS